MLRTFTMALWCSGDPFRRFTRADVTCASRPHRSIRVRRISSVGVSTRIVSSVLLDRANRGLLVEVVCTGSGGCIACNRNEEEERVSACSHTAENRRDKNLEGRVLVWLDGE